MIVIGLTGSIAMGKSETARMFQSLGIALFDSDREVHQIYGKSGAAVAAIANRFPGVVVDGIVDRSRLAQRVLHDSQELADLEAIVHPLVSRLQSDFIERQRAAGAELVVLDIPLLFEKGRQNDVDVVVVVSAPPGMQRERALSRPGMTPEKFDAIVRKQIPDAEKRRRADFAVDSSRGLAPAFEQVQQIVRKLKDRAAGYHA